ncbi:MAG: hypothetical protein Q4A78_09940 [Peptostreptococcaceae bacterium]|nr:hypothetical protein [Peptostreptococcaceae bacterium]
MKKVLVFAMCLLMTLSLFGCGGGKKMEANFAGEARKVEFATEDLMSGTGNNVVGKYGYIDLSDKALEDIDTKALRAFIVANESELSELNWFTIILKDGKAISFPDSILGRYGTLDNSDKTVSQEKLLILFEEGDYKIEDLEEE